ncbi:MAG: IS66 family transposase [Niameybacter sp.]
MNQLTARQQEIETLKSQLKAKDVRIASLEKLNNWYLEQLKLRRQKQFGASSEKCSEDQIAIDDLFADLFNEAEALREPLVVEPEACKVIPTHNRKKAKRGSKFEDLPVEVIEYKLTDAEKVCSTCSDLLTEMKKEIRKELVIIPAQVKVVEHVTYTYSCRNCDKKGTSSSIKSAVSPKALIPRSVVSPSIMAYIMNQKYTNAMPLYRQEQEFKRYDIKLNRQDLSNWTLKGAALLKSLFEALKEALLENELLHADETTLEVLNEPGRNATAKSYEWLYRTTKNAERPVIIYDYQVGRSGEYVKSFLKDWKGTYLHCDGYVGYKKLENTTLCGCLVHAKRKFHEAWQVNQSNATAKEGEAYIQKLFAIEAQADQLKYTDSQRLELRKTESKKTLDEFYTWIDKISPKTLPQSLLGKAITYAQNQKVYLSNFLKDGRIQLSNNLAEQSIKMFVIGRKNWLFSNTQNGATSSSIIYSIIQTAIANELKPMHYLEHVFKQIQLNKDLQISDILPWSASIPETCKKINTPQS